MSLALAGPTGGKAPIIAPKGPNKAPGVGKTPPKVPTPKTGAPKSAAGKIAAGKAASNGLEPIVTTSPSTLGKLASSAAAKIYNPIMANYNTQMKQASGLAQKRTADVTAFGQWYGQQQNALAAQEQQRQSSLNSLLGTLGSNTATTPQNGIQSSIGTNMANPTGGAEQLAAQGNNQAQSGILSTQALSNESETNSGQNMLTALGGAYQQNMMAAISSDLTKTQTTIEDAASKALTSEGTNAAKIDTSLTSYLNNQNKNIVAQNKNVIQGNYDQQQANAKTINEIEATAATTGKMTPAMAAAIARLSGGATPSTGATTKAVANSVAATKAAQTYTLGEQKNNQTAYENVTKRLAVAATNAKTKDSYIIDTIKNNIAQAEAGAKVTVSNAEAKYYAARSGLSVTQAKADLVKAYAYAQHYGTSGNSGGTAAGIVPLTTNEAMTELNKTNGYQNVIHEMMTGQTIKGVPNPPRTQKAMRRYIRQTAGAGGSLDAALQWAAFDMYFYKGLTPRTSAMLQNQGIPRGALSSYKVIQPKVK